MPRCLQITSSNNPLVKHIVKIREDSGYRNQCQLVLVSGYTMVREIAELVEPLQIFTTNPGQDKNFRAEIYQVSAQVLKKLSGLMNPEGIAAVFKLPPATPLENKKRVLICEGIADPGNLGTLMRTALALGFEGIFLLGQGVDPFHEKVMRASRAALFKLPYEIGDWKRLREITNDHTSSCFVADINGQPVGADAHDTIFLLLSNESLGVSPEAKLFGKKVSIPMSGPMESLNVSVAGAILMYCLSKRS